MHSLRAKLLLSFCLLEVLIIATIVVVVGASVRRDTGAQKMFVAEAIEERAREGLRDHLRLLDMLLLEDRRDCLRAVELVTRSPATTVSVERFDVKHLQQFLATAAATANLDILTLYDLDGRVVASFPRDIDDLAAAREFAGWAPLQLLQTQAKETLDGVAALPPKFLEAHGVAATEDSTPALGQVILQVMSNEFGDELAIVLGAKLLNGNHTPYQRAHRVSEHGSALYAGGAPVAWAGFGAGEAQGSAAPPSLDAAVLGEFSPGEPFREEHLPFPAGPMLVTTAPLLDLAGVPAGFLLATLPEATVAAASDHLGATSDAMLRDIQSGVLLIGAGALAVFFCTALFIEARLISRPLKPVVEGLRDLAQGEADLTRTLPANTEDEVGRLAENFNRFLGHMRAWVLRSRDTADDIRKSIETIQRSSQAVHSGAMRQTENLVASHGAVLAIEEGAASIEALSRTLVLATETTSSATQQMGATAQEIAAKMDELFQLVDQVSASIHQMSSMSSQVTNSVESLAATAQQTAASIGEMDANIDQVRRGAERTGTVAEEAARNALTGKQAVDATVAGVEALSGMVEASTGVIRTLAHRSGEIGGILTTISDIAEKTNLLALNASIIAAQAGRHGTGFGVVANEIKTLAASTKTSAKEITGIVRGLQEVAQQAVESTESGRAQVQAEVERAREAGARLDRILLSSEESHSQAAEIARTTQEQAETSRQITQSVQQVADMLSQITAAVQEQTQGYHVLAGASVSMHEIASLVKHGTNEQAIGSEQIATAMEHVRDLLEKIDTDCREQTSRSQAVLVSVADVLEIARSNTSVTADFDAAVVTLTRQAETLQQEVDAFKT